LWAPVLSGGGRAPSLTVSGRAGSRRPAPAERGRPQDGCRGDLDRPPPRHASSRSCAAPARASPSRKAAVKAATLAWPNRDASCASTARRSADQRSSVRSIEAPDIGNPFHLGRDQMGSPRCNCNANPACVAPREGCSARVGTSSSVWATLLAPLRAGVTRLSSTPGRSPSAPGCARKALPWAKEPLASGVPRLRARHSGVSVAKQAEPSRMNMVRGPLAQGRGARSGGQGR
jgi:hypothetical protein